MVSNDWIFKRKQTFSSLHSLMYERNWRWDLVDVKRVKQAIEGDDEAFLLLMKAHKEALFKTALAYLKNEEDALEAIQEVIFRAYENIHTVQKPKYIKTWLIRIMMNYCNDVLRKRQRFISDEKVLLKHGMNDDYTYLEVEEALETLTNEERELIYMRYLHEIKIKEIAEMTHKPEGTVKTRLYKTLGKMRTFFSEKE